MNPHATGTMTSSFAGAVLQGPHPPPGPVVDDGGDHKQSVARAGHDDHGNQDELAGHNSIVRAEYADMPDSELWRRARDHDGTAFGELFERHSTAVYNHCFRRTASWSTAQDLTSVVFLDAWRRRKDVRLHGDSILPWLLVTANNATRNANRSIRRYQRLLVKLPPATSQLGSEEEAGNRVDDERSMALILDKVNSLRVEEREIIALCDWTDLSYAEAATALGVPVGTVRSRLSRAHQHLRKLIDDDPDPHKRGILATLFDSPKETDAHS